MMEIRLKNRIKYPMLSVIRSCILTGFLTAPMPGIFLAVIVCSLREH